MKAVVFGIDQDVDDGLVRDRRACPPGVRSCRFHAARASWRRAPAVFDRESDSPTVENSGLLIKRRRRRDGARASTAWRSHGQRGVPALVPAGINPTRSDRVGNTITATQMLDSMMQVPAFLRAEVVSVANAICISMP